MKRIEINVGGTAYPCYPTMGAMLRFRQETGREVTEIDASGLSDLCTYLWCCVASASKREGLEFGLSLMDFADRLDPSVLEDWGRAVTEPADGGAAGKKKK